MKVPLNRSIFKFRPCKKSIKKPFGMNGSFMDFMFWRFAKTIRCMGWRYLTRFFLLQAALDIVQQKQIFLPPAFRSNG
jgi:hypothetical protein